MEDKIFISIASYRDPETIPTILDALNKAKNPNNLNIGLLLQDSESTDTSAIDKNKNIKILKYDWRESSGACWARSEIQESLYDNEKYYFQLDSHHRFCENWDEILINLLEEIRTKFKKPIVGGYCPSYNPQEKNLTGYPCKMNSYPDFTNQGDLFFSPRIIKDHNKLSKKNVNYIPARFLSGHFIFCDGVFCKECPYDPNLYFRGEELSLSARAYTSGYDFFHPTKSIVWHYYIRKDEQKHWDNHVKDNGFLITGNQRADNAKARVRALLNMESTKTIFHRFGLGKLRSLHDYELYAGLDLKTRRIHKYAYDIKNIYKPPYVMSEFEWSNGMMKKYKLEFDIDIDLLKNIKSNNIDTLSIIPENKSNLPVYRKDLKQKQVQALQNKNILESSMDEQPSQIAIVRHVNEKIEKLTTINEFRIL